MASTLASGPVCMAVLTLLRASVGLVALVPADRIGDDVASRTAYPYVVVEGAGESPNNTLGGPSLPKWGSFARVVVRVVSQYRGEQEAYTVLDQVKQALDGQPLTVTGYPSVGVSFENTTMLKDTVVGVVTRELIGEFEVMVHQS